MTATENEYSPGATEWQRSPPPNAPVTLPLSNSSPATWAPFSSSGALGIAPPQDLCTCCSPAWKALPPDSYMAPPSLSFRSLLKCHLLREVFFDGPSFLIPFPALHPLHTLHISPVHCPSPQLECQFHKGQGRCGFLFWGVRCCIP